MDLNIIAKHIDLTSEAETYINKKFRRLQRHLRSLSGAKLEVSRTSARARDERCVAQMTLTVNGSILRGEMSGTDLFAAVDAVTDVLDRQVQRYKWKSNRTEQASDRAGPGPAASPNRRSRVSKWTPLASTCPSSAGSSEASSSR